LILNRLNGAKLLGIVNCVGTAHFSAYTDTSDNQINTIHNVNINSLHFLLRLNQHLQAKQATEDSQFFINISSVTARQPFKYSLVYAATKAYLSNLIEGMQQEQEKMVFLDVQPWFVKTKMIAYQQSWDSVDPEEIVKGAMRVLGKRSVCSGCLKHELVDQFCFLREDDERVEEKMKKAIRLR
jgi:short-subunit dehydrogenase